MRKELWLKIIGVWLALTFSFLLWAHAAAPVAPPAQAPAAHPIVIKSLPTD